MPRLGPTKKKKSLRATELSQLKEKLRRVTEQLESRDRELGEALEQQIATGEILRVIASSPTDLQPVLDSVITNAVKLARAQHGHIRQYDGELLRVVAHCYEIAESVDHSTVWPVSLSSESISGRAVLERIPVHVLDAATEFGPNSLAAHGRPTRTILTVPLVRQGETIGTISIWREVVHAFTDEQIKLVTTFADQAVIAIENVRLFQELQTRTGELAQSVEELKALGDVSRAVSSTLDLETVLTSIVSNAVQLSGTDGGTVYEFDEESQEFHLRATHRLDERLIDALRANPPRLGEAAMGRASKSREPVEIPDILEADAYDWPLRDLQADSGVRAVLAIPLLREDRVIGCLVVRRKSPGKFRPEVIDLLKTFATQSALAIQNARLFQNIEEQRQQLKIANEQLREIDRLKSSFLSNVSHELRTPLTAIGGIAENLLDGTAGALNEKQAHYITGIKESGDRLARLIDDLLDLSAIEANRIRITPTSFLLDDLVHKVAEMLRPIATVKSVALDAPARNEQILARADRDRITQVLTNLVINAVKFTPAGGKVALTLEPSIEDNWLQVNVTDSGPGIPTAEVENIFDEFYQISQPDREKTGVGLGLAICKRLVEMHGGAIWVDSAQGRGSSFHFTVPAAQMTSQEPSAGLRRRP